MATEMHVLTNSYNGHRLVRYVNVIDPIPPGAIRVRTSDGLEPKKTNNALYTKCEKVDGYEDVYDVFQESGSDYVWNRILRSPPNMIEVLGSNASGVTACSEPFYESRNLTAVNNFELCTGSNNSLFYLCRGLQQVSLLHTERATSTNSWFQSCNTLPSVPLFDIPNVTSTNSMFGGCWAMTSVPLFNMSSVTTMSYMFNQCYALTEVPTFDTSNVSSMHSTFQSCSGLTAVPLLNTNKVYDMESVFNYCTNVKNGALALYQQASTQTTPPKYHSYAFRYCGSATVEGRAELAQIPAGWK